MAINAYTVLSEFKFEVGGAIAGAGKVESAVDGISNAAKDAQSSLMGLGLSFVGTFGVGTSSLLGLLGKSITSFDKFKASQLQFANLISSNMDNLSGDITTFNDRLGVSKKIIEDISKDAIKFGLDEGSLLSMTKMMTAALVPKGLAGRDFGNARDLSRNLMKSAPSLGVDPDMVQNQLFRIIEGKAGMNNTLFRRLALETSAFQDKLKGAKNAASAFNKLPLKERFKTLQEGMSQFSSDADVLAGNAMTLSSMFSQFRNLTSGVNSVLKPLGEAIMPLIIQVFTGFTKTLNNDGRKSIVAFSEIFKMLVTDVESAAISLYQAQQLSGDFKGASKASTGAYAVDVAAGFFGWKKLFVGVLGALGLTFKVASGAVRLLVSSLGFLLPVIKLVALGLAEFMVVLAPMLFLFQTLSRAKGMAKAEDLKLLPGVLTALAEQTQRFIAIAMIYAQPWIDMMNYLAAKISFLYRTSFWLEIVVDLFGVLNTGLTLLSASLRGILFVALEFIKNIASGSFGKAFSMKSSLAAFDEGATSIFEELEKKTKSSDGVTNTSQQTTYMNVNMYNQFKEQLQPDRIAVTVQNQLLKAATNPRQAKGRSLQRGTVQ